MAVTSSVIIRFLRDLARSELAATGLVVILAGAGILGLRSAGVLESVELAAYDWYIRLRPFDPGPDRRILLVTVTESDLQAQSGWPLSDRVVGRMLEILARSRPRAIGLDIYRDVPVPPGTNQLHAVLTRERRIITVMKFGEGSSGGVRPPPVLRDTDQVAFDDVLVDAGGTVRRGLLFLDDGTKTAYSFALRLALLYLEADGVRPQASEEDPGQLRLAHTTIRPFEANDGAYVGADAHGYQFLLDFKGGKGSFPAVSLTALLSGAVSPETIRDKVVLIGVTAESVKDYFFTPHSRGLGVQQQIAGVALHAQVVSQLLRIGLEGASPTATASRWQEVVWVLVWSALGGLVGLRVRSAWRFSLATGGAVVGLALVDFLAFWAGWWLPLVPAEMTCVISSAVVTAYMSHRETVQRAILMQLFSRHVSKEVAEAIWQQRDQFLDGRRPRSQRLTATILFTDLTGFTTVSEKLQPEALMEWLNEGMDAMARQVSRYGGVIEQYAGDAIVAVFGVPVPRQSDLEICQDAINAVNCALALEDTLRELNQRWRAAGRAMTGMRIGIFTGAVVAGTLGSAERSEYVVVGDTVNTASRLESFDKDLFPPDPEKRPCRILIGERTRRCLGEEFETEHVGDVSLKGKEQSVAVYRVVARAGASSRALTEEGRG